MTTSSSETRATKRLLIVTPYFPPEMGAPQARLSELGSRLQERGWCVEVLTALPNYPTGRIFDGYAPLRVAVETIASMRTVRVPLYPSNRGFVRRLASYFSFVLAACWWGPRRCARPDVLLIESPPLFTGLAGRYLGWRWRCPWVFNISDLWPESAVRMGVLRADSLPTRLATWLEHALYRKAAAVTGQSTETIDAVKRAVPERRTAVITNGVEPERFGKEQADDEARTLLGDAPGPIFLYAGLLGLAQGLDPLLDAVAELPIEVPGRLVLVGAGPLRAHLATRIAEEKLERVRLVDPQPRERVPALLACADVAMISLGGSLPGAVPSKIYEAMAAALPILMVAADEAAARVAQAPCGLIAPPGDQQALLDGWTRLATDEALRQELGTAGRREAETRYSRSAIAAELDRVLRAVVEPAQ